MDDQRFLAEYEDVLLPEDLKKILHVGLNTIYKYLNDGTIRSIRVAGKYRIPKQYLIDFMYPNAEEKEVK